MLTADGLPLHFCFCVTFSLYPNQVAGIFLSSSHGKCFNLQGPISLACLRHVFTPGPIACGLGPKSLGTNTAACIHPFGKKSISAWKEGGPGHSG